jgi:hypothetical protein
MGLFLPTNAFAHFDPQGNYTFDPRAVHTESFESLPSWNPAQPDPNAIKNLFTLNDPGALEGNRVGAVSPEWWAEGVRLPVTLPPLLASYRIRLWIRSGWLAATFVVDDAADPLQRSVADLSATGRCTSDGWVEMASAPVTIDGLTTSAAFLYLMGDALIDGFEIVEEGVVKPSAPCLGARDLACGKDEVCIAGLCRAGDTLVPHWPPPAERSRVVDFLFTRLQYFFGGHQTRRDHLPDALAQVEAMRTATSAWEFWHGFATAVRKLHDWHTSASGAIQFLQSPYVLNACFIEGKADLSQHAWPSDSSSFDWLVSHVGPDRNVGLKPGDRLVAIDGMHPLQWARSLIDVSWDWWQADDDRVNAEFAEVIRGLIPKYAQNFSIVRCHAETGTCDDTPDLIEVSSLPRRDEIDEPLVACDNRPSYHLVQGPDPTTHNVGWNVFVGLLEDSQPGENLYGITWDSLWGPTTTPIFLKANETFKANARGVILDHRAGNGGTIDAPEAITQLVREPLDIAIFIHDRPWADYEGASTVEEGLAIFERYKKNTHYPDLTYSVGSAKAKLDLPVALLQHRDGSASDYLPFGMKGSPRVRIFGPQPTAGAFSSFFQMALGGNMRLSLASGDTIAYDGQALIGHGVEPDEIVVPLQSDLIHGKDTLYLRALAWLRSELDP